MALGSLTDILLGITNLEVEYSMSFSSNYNKGDDNLTIKYILNSYGTTYAWKGRHPDVCKVIDKAGPVASEAAPAISLVLSVPSFPLSLTMLPSYFQSSEWKKGD